MAIGGTEAILRLHLFLDPCAEPSQLVHCFRVHFLAKLEFSRGLNLGLVDVGFPPATRSAESDAALGSASSDKPSSSLHVVELIDQVSNRRISPHSRLLFRSTRKSCKILSPSNSANRGIFTIRQYSYKSQARTMSPAVDRLRSDTP